MVIVIILFLIGLLFMCKGGDMFVDEAVYIAKKLHISELVIGATVVSIGTTLPELTVSTLSSIDGNTAIAYGNAIGTIICNTALIGGILLLFSYPKIKRSEISLTTIFFFLTFFMLLTFAICLHFVNFVCGIVLLLMYFLYILFTIKKSRKSNMNNILINTTKPNKHLDKTSLKHIAMLLFSVLLIYFGSRLLIDNAVRIAQSLKISERIIALTIIAFGTSLPEFVTAITSIIKKHGAVSLGNIIGANFINLTIVIGTSSVIKQIDTPFYLIKNDLIFLLVSMIILTIPTIIKTKTFKLQGILLVLLYVLYNLILFT